MAEKILPAYFNGEFLEAAFEQARLAIEEGEVPVGCVFVKHNRTVQPPRTKLNGIQTSASTGAEEITSGSQIIARGRNTVNATRNATRHAEMNCIDVVHYNILKGWCYFFYKPDLFVLIIFEPCF